MKTGYVIEKSRTDGFKVWLNESLQWDEWRMNRKVWTSMGQALVVRDDAGLDARIVKVRKNDHGAWCTPSEFGGDRRVS